MQSLTHMLVRRGVARRWLRFALLSAVHWGGVATNGCGFTSTGNSAPVTVRRAPPMSAVHQPPIGALPI